MPNRDKTGPRGKGPMTGGGLGGCSKEDMKTFKDMGYFDKGPKIPNRPFDGRGQGKGPGLGIGRNNSKRGR